MVLLLQHDEDRQLVEGSRSHDFELRNIGVSDNNEEKNRAQNRKRELRKCDDHLDDSVSLDY